jgi:two-component system, LytTR family, sensor kinase
MARDKDDIWSFSPFIDLSIYRLDSPQPSYSAPVRLADHVFHHHRGAALSCRWNGRATSRIRFSAWRARTSGWKRYLRCFGDCGRHRAEKIFNSVRIQIKLEEQERLLLHARMEALQNQINPHFLFNTLNSISSLVRVDPETARDVIFKLATILRRLLSSGDAFARCGKSLNSSITISISKCCVWPGQVEVVKDFDPASLDVMVPSMLLQPLVENSIKHGLAPKVEGGSVFLRSRITDSQVVIMKSKTTGSGWARRNWKTAAVGRGWALAWRTFPSGCRCFMAIPRA